MKELWLWAALIVVVLLGEAIFFEWFLRKSRARGRGWTTVLPDNPVAGLQQVREVELLNAVKNEIHGTTEAVESANELWANADYYWIVLCKNRRFHHHSNHNYEHRIPLGRTDTVLPKPVSQPFKARCTSCGKEYVYAPSEVLRWEMETPESFEPHPLFLD
jgi:hypothetical protein